MKILQIGSGSMGTRRLRDLRERKDVSLALFDPRADRRERARQRFGIEVFSHFDDALAWQPDALVISTPPGTKRSYIETAIDRSIHHFSEADIWTYDAAGIERASLQKEITSVPSASLLFLPVVKALKARVREHLGSLLFYQAFMATYMPGWHPDEGKEYYAHHRNTTAAREMIPFELTWLFAVFGAAAEVAGRFDRHGALEEDFEDTWSLSMRLKTGGAGQLAISMACPVNCRRGSAFGTQGMVAWDIYSGDLSVSNSDHSPPRVESFGATKDVLEGSYFEEINTFVDSILGTKIWPQSYTLSNLSSATLAAAEMSSVSGSWRTVSPGAEPAFELPGRP